MNYSEKGKERRRIVLACFAVCLLAPGATPVLATELLIHKNVDSGFGGGVKYASKVLHSTFVLQIMAKTCNSFSQPEKYGIKYHRTNQTTDGGLVSCVGRSLV
jgi:hypothetical protein